jgi:hypothetical protein
MNVAVAILLSAGLPGRHIAACQDGCMGKNTAVRRLDLGYFIRPASETGGSPAPLPLANRPGPAAATTTLREDWAWQQPSDRGAGCRR